MMVRNFKVLLSIVLLMMAGAGQAWAEPVKILALGTSITQGYGLPPGTEFTVQLQAALKRDGIDAAVTNAGVSGDTSAGGLARLDWSLADHPDAVILELGGNDMLRGIAPAETEKNLRAILARLKAAHMKVLLTGMRAQRNLGADYVRQFDGIYPKLARETGVLFYPFILDGVALNPKLNQADGMHPNPAGVKIVVARILPLVKKLVAKEGKKA
ncbi:MAG: arylesterase [Alphaproteobacteria bacterium]|nr:arylesterase [Alphaproteobacteria bacterium]